jgi:hypothetical protein
MSITELIRRYLQALDIPMDLESTSQPISLGTGRHFERCFHDIHCRYFKTSPHPLPWPLGTPTDCKVFRNQVAKIVASIGDPDIKSFRRSHLDDTAKCERLLLALCQYVVRMFLLKDASLLSHDALRARVEALQEDVHERLSAIQNLRQELLKIGPLEQVEPLDDRLWQVDFESNAPSHGLSQSQSGLKFRMLLWDVCHP